MSRLALLSLFVGSHALALDFEITSLTVGQGDQIRRFDDGRVVVLNRRRVTEILGLRIFHLLPEPDPDSPKTFPRLQLVGQLRFDTNFGDFVEHRDDAGIVAVPEIEDDQFDLTLLYLEGKDFLRGTVDFRAGRQVIEEQMDWRAFDGGHLFFHPPIYLGMEVFGGVEVRGADALSTSVMEPDGTSIGLLSEEPEAVAPIFGGAIRTHGLRDLHLRGSYRRSVSRSGLLACPGDCSDEPDSFGPAEITGVREELVAFSATGRLWDLLRPYASFRYNLLVARPDLLEGGMRIGWARHAFTPAYLHRTPTFVGDSIFNVFSTYPYQEGSLTYDVVPPGATRVYAKYLVRRYANEASGSMTQTSALHHGSSTGGVWALRRGFIRIDGRLDLGYGGTTGGGDVSGQWRLYGERLRLDGRVTALRYEGDSRTRDALLRREFWSFGFQAGALYVIADGIAIHLLGEENVNPLYESYFRMLALLDLAYRP